MKLAIRSTEDLDIDIIALNIREADLMEIEASGTKDPRDALQNAYDICGPECFTIVMDELPIAMFGTAKVELIPEFASIWLLGTDDITNTAPISFLRIVKKVFKHVIEPYEMVFNVMDKRNEFSIRFVKWLGFSFIREIPYGPNSVPFYEFALINKRRSHV